MRGRQRVWDKKDTKLSIDLRSASSPVDRFPICDTRQHPEPAAGIPSIGVVSKGRDVLCGFEGWKGPNHHRGGSKQDECVLTSQVQIDDESIQGIGRVHPGHGSFKGEESQNAKTPSGVNRGRWIIGQEIPFRYRGDRG